MGVLLSWTGENGADLYAHGKCRDISLDGLRVETLAAIPAQSHINVRVEKMEVSGSARVRYVRRGRMGHVLGLELRTQVRQQLLDALRDATPGS